MLNTVVCIKAVPEPKEAGKIRIDPATKNLMRSNVPLVLNPLDKNAMEAALGLKKSMDAHITVISMGPPAAGDIVKECLALGADQGILLSDRAFGGADAYATAYTLARGIEKTGAFDVIFCGMSSSDGATEWVGPEMATFLNVPVVTMVSKIVESDRPLWKIKAKVENGYRLMQVKLPVVLTVTIDINTPKTLSFSGIIKARKKQILQWTASDIGVAEESIGLKGSPTIVANMEAMESKREATIITGTREEKAQMLLQKLVGAGVVS